MNWIAMCELLMPTASRPITSNPEMGLGQLQHLSRLGVRAKY